MILLLSGGLDSLAAWRLLGLPDAIRFDLGTRSVEREDAAVSWAEREWGGRVIRQSLPLAHAEMANGYLPLRNPLMVLAAAQHDREVMVAQVAEWAPDKSARFWRRLASVATQAVRGDSQGVGGRVTITAPFAHLTKGELLRRYAVEFGYGEAVRLCCNTWSCYEAKAIHCGRCSGCAQRWVAERVAFGHGVTLMVTAPDVRPSRDHWRDAVRWIRDNRLAGVRQLLARRREIEIEIATRGERWV